MSRRVKEFIEIEDHSSLEELIAKLIEVRNALPADSEAELRLRGDDVFGRKLSISYFRDQTAEEFGQPRQVLVRQAIVEAGQILVTNGLGDSRRLRGLPRERWQMLQAPVSRRDQACVNTERLGHRSRALSYPNGEDERKPGPVFPRRAQVREMGIALLIGQQQGRIADHQHGIVRKTGQRLQVAVEAEHDAADEPHRSDRVERTPAAVARADRV